MDKQFFSTNFEGKLTAQVLYNLRAVTGFCSGDELHALFQQLVGDLSPPSHRTFRAYRLGTVGGQVGQTALDLLNDGALICQLADYSV